MKKINNGGAIAEKGFNYQSAVGVFIIFNNYKNNSFSICFENADDIEVLIDNHHIFIQVKSSLELNTKNIIYTKDNSSILSKLWDKNENDSFNYRYKLVAPDFRIQDNNNKYKSIINENFSKGLIFKNSVYNMKSYITIPAELQGYKSKLDNSYIVITPFRPSLKEAQTYLKGFLSECEQTIANGIIKQIVEEIFFLTKEKSEILIDNETTSFNEKSINSAQIQKIINKGKEFEALKQTALYILKKIENEIFPLLYFNIEKCINGEIDHLFRVYKDCVSELIGNFDLKEDVNFANLIVKQLYPLCLLQNTELQPKEVYTIIIALVADKINRQQNDN